MSRRKRIIRLGLDCVALASTGYQVNLLIPSYILSHVSCNKCLNHNNLEICKLHINYHCDDAKAETSGQ